MKSDEILKYCLESGRRGMGLSMRIATGTECLRRWYDLKPERILERIFWESGGVHGIL